MTDVDGCGRVVVPGGYPSGTLGVLHVGYTMDPARYRTPPSCTPTAAVTPRPPLARLDPAVLRACDPWVGRCALPVVRRHPSEQNCPLDADLQWWYDGVPAVQRWYSVGFTLIMDSYAKPVNNAH